MHAWLYVSLGKVTDFYPDHLDLYQPCFNCVLGDMSAAYSHNSVPEAKTVRVESRHPFINTSVNLKNMNVTMSELIFLFSLSGMHDGTYYATVRTKLNTDVLRVHCVAWLHRFNHAATSSQSPPLFNTTRFP